MSERYSFTTGASRFRFVFSLLLAVGSIMLEVEPAKAQPFFGVGNRFINAMVSGDRTSGVGGGRFYIETGREHDLTKFLYSTTSCVVFRIRATNYTYYYTNAKPVVGEEPRDDRNLSPVPYAPFDSLYTSPDTVAVVWKNLSGFTITQRLFTERPRTIFDDGGDIIIEYSYTSDPFRPAELGIFLMLDAYNSDAKSVGGSSDRSSILTSEGYFPFDRSGRRFQRPYDSIPAFYHVGDFTYQPEPNLNSILSIHRLTGYSHGGLPLTTPDMFAVGSWSNFKYRSWEIQGGDVGRSLGDCATVLRWEGLVARTGTIRTAFGLSDRKGNNLYHCRDEDVFIDIKTERLVEQKERGGEFTPSQFDATIWITNTSRDAATYSITLMEPIGAPDLTGRLTRDESTPATQSIYVPASGTRKLSWRLNVVPGINDSLIHVPLDFRYMITGSDGPPRMLKDKCMPLVAIQGWQDTILPPPPPKDTLPPPIVRLNRARNPLPAWTFRTFDRHLDYLHDSGLDSILVEINEGDNFTFSYTPDPFTQCDTTIDVDLKAQVIDTTKRGRIVFMVRDCYGNVTRDSALYDPRPDIFKPEIENLITLGSFGPECNARVYEYRLVDSLNQTSTAGDAGFGSIEVIPPLVNFAPIEINPDRGFAPIRPFDYRASFRLQVIDSMENASAMVRVVDFAGNADTIEVNYCALPDTLPPVMTVTPIPPADPRDPVRKWRVHAGDMRAWDRGLESIVELSGTNMQFVPPAITPGLDSLSFEVEVLDGELDGEIVLQARDLFYGDDPVRHADTIRLVYLKTPDTLAPNIIFHPVPGTSGSIVDVEVNDIHYFGSELYRFDRGLADVHVSAISSNIELVTPITFSAGDRTMQFRIRVIDTLKLHPFDSICIAAADLYDNHSGNCYYYPLLPDIYSPVFAGAMTPDRRRITGITRDTRLYDRGLGAVRLENGVNVALDLPGTGLAGVPNYGIGLTVADPMSEISGTLVISDLVAELDPAAETQLMHAVRIPFRLPVVRLRLELPMDVEAAENFEGAILTDSPFTGDEVGTIRFDASYAGEAGYTGTRDAMAAIAATEASGRLALVLSTVPGRQYRAGDTLGFIGFKARGTEIVETFSLEIDRSTLVVNEGEESLITAAVPGDTENSTLTLPAPYAAILADSLVYVNGDCERILNSRGGHSKITGFAILGVMPQPATPAGGKVELDIRELPADGAQGELISPDGYPVAAFTIEGTGAPLTRASLILPGGLAPGAYFLRLSTATDHTWVKIMIIE